MSMTSAARLAIFVLTAVLPAVAQAAPQAQPPGFGLPRIGEQQSFGDSRDRVKVSAIPAQQQVVPGSDVPVAIILDHEAGWHTWANAGNVPAGMARFDGAIHTEVKVADSTSPPLEVHQGFVQWPDVHAAEFGAGSERYAVFSDQAVIYVPVSIKPDAPMGEATLALLITFQACDESTCLPPVVNHELLIPIEIVDLESAAHRPSVESGEVFSEFEASIFGRIHAGEPGAEPPRTPPASQATRPMFFGQELPRTDGALGMLVLAVLSMVGGFVLNLTPCVLPIIPIKIMTISQHAGSRGRSFALGAWMALGVVAFWLGIGIPAALFTSFADPSRLFGIWWLTLAIGAIIGCMGVGIMGLFTMQLPAAVYSVNPKADTAWGSFLFGVMTGVLGLPCFGFVAGALLVGAAALPTAMIMVIFASIGVGMALPYLVLAAKPALVSKIPRTGPASELVKQVMGLLLLAAAAYFVGSGLIALVIDHPYLAKQLHWWIAALCAVLAGLWLVLRTFQISPKPLPRIVFTVVGLVVGGLAVMFAWDSTAKAKSVWIARQSELQAAPGEYLAGVWNPYTTASFEKARADGKVVVLDFTAEWCLTCKVLKAQVLNPDPVKTALQSKDVVPFTVDLTSNTDPGWDFLRELGRTGIPTLAIFSPGEQTPWLANAYTSGQVMAALAEARSKRVAGR